MEIIMYVKDENDSNPINKYINANRFAHASPTPTFLLSVLEFIGIVLIVGIKCSSQGTHIQPRNVKVSTCPDVVESGKGGGLFEILSSWQAKKKKKREDFI